jgi:hypothetical protein
MTFILIFKPGIGAAVAPPLVNPIAGLLHSPLVKLVQEGCADKLETAAAAKKNNRSHFITLPD